MKKYILLLPGAVFPYTLLFALYCVFTGFLTDSLFNNNVLILLFYLFLFFMVSLACNIIFFVLGICKNWNSRKISMANMIIKCVQIPAYILIFVLGIVFLFTIFTFGFSIFFVLFDCCAIFLTGLTGLCAVIRGYVDGKISKSFFIVNGLLQFIFCADVISAIIVFKKNK